MQNFKLLMMNLLMLLNMLNEIFLRTIISIKWPKTVGNTCRLFLRITLVTMHQIHFNINVMYCSLYSIYLALYISLRM